MNRFLDRRLAAAHLNLALDQSDDRFMEALEEVVRAWGMSEVERSAGLKHTVIYGVFRGKPQFDTVCRVLKGLGLNVTITQRGKRL
jgi:probable addiction module antidote protein